MNDDDKLLPRPACKNYSNLEPCLSKENVMCAWVEIGDTHLDELDGDGRLADASAANHGQLVRLRTTRTTSG